MSVMMFLISLFGIVGNPSDPDDFECVENEYKNVILLIGDGMGFNSIELTVQQLGLESYEMQRAEYAGQSRTRSANKLVTDSAAGGTALATGVKTNNGYLGIYAGDKNSHNNDAAAMADALKAFDEAVGVAFDYADENPDTLVVVTADHETGGIKLDKESGKYVYTSTDHTSANVPVYVYGCDSFIEQGEIIENTDIPVKISRFMGTEDFPKKIKR